MKALVIALLAASAAPAFAQHQGHSMPGMSMPAPKAKAPPKPTKPKPAKRKPAARSGHSAQAPAGSQSREGARARDRMSGMKMQPATADPHAGHDMSGMETQPAAADPHAGHDMNGMKSQPEAADPHAGHDMSRMETQPAAADPHAGHDMTGMKSQPANADPHAGHDMAAMETGAPGEPAAPPVGPPPAAALSGPAHAADAVYGAAPMAAARDEMRRMHGDIRASRILIDQAEARIRGGREGWYLNGEAWFGGDIDRLWLKTEAEGEFGHSPERAEVEALWSRALNPWFNLQAGLRYDFRPDPERAWLTLGIEGLAPYWIEVDAAAFLSTKGELTARIEGEHDLRLTQKLVLQPRAELNLSAQDVPELGLGSGLSSAEAGLRLRYHFVPEFAPYLGVAWERAFGKTADFRRAEGEHSGGWSLVLGVRTWF